MPTKLFAAAALALLATGHARADDRPFAKPAHTVAFSGLVFEDEACQVKFGGSGSASGDDLARLVNCIDKLGVSSLGTNQWLTEHTQLMFVTTVTDGLVTAIGPVEPTPTDRALPTMKDRVALRFRPSRELQKKLDDKGVKLGQVELKICLDIAGAVTSVRAIRGSGVDDYDRDLIAWAKKEKVAPFIAGGHQKVAVCSVSYSPKLPT